MFSKHWQAVKGLVVDEQAAKGKQLAVGDNVVLQEMQNWSLNGQVATVEAFVQRKSTYQVMTSHDWGALHSSKLVKGLKIGNLVPLKPAATSDKELHLAWQHCLSFFSLQRRSAEELTTTVTNSSLFHLESLSAKLGKVPHAVSELFQNESQGLLSRGASFATSWAPSFHQPSIFASRRC